MENFYNKRFVFSLILMQLCLATSEKTDEANRNGKGYFGFCGEKEIPGRIVDANSCPHGAWFSQPVPVTRAAGCVCLNGVWAISHDWCDDNYFVAYGEGHCFKLDKKVQKLSFLGDSTDAFKPSNFITTKKGDVFRKFTENENGMFHLHKSPTYDHHTILMLRPDKQQKLVIEFEEKPKAAGSNVKYENDIKERDDSTIRVKTLCLNSGSNGMQHHSNKRLLIYKAKESIKSVKIAKKCPENINSDQASSLVVETAITLYPGQILQVKNGVITESSVRCQKQCFKETFTPAFEDYQLNDDDNLSNNDILSRSKRQAKTKTKTEAVPEIKLDLAKSPPEEKQVVAAVDEEVKDDVSSVVPGGPGGSSLTDMITDALGTDNEDTNFEPLKLERGTEDRTKTVNVANIRVARQELNWLLEGIRPPTLKTPSWGLVKKLKEVFAKACPKVEAPKFLLNAMMRLFRLFYLNSKEYYPNGYMVEEKEQFQRIEKSLDSCVKDATAINFNYTHIQDPMLTKCRKVEEEVEDAKGDWVFANVTYCHCVEKLHGVNFSYAQNLTGPPDAISLYSETNLTMSEDLYFLMHEHSEGSHTKKQYHDFPTETVWKMITFGHYYCSKYFRDNPADHSALMTRLEDLFNEDIIYRWKHPGLYGDKIWQFLYSTFSLKKFALAIDACVSSAKFVSEYPEWINRPTTELRRRKKRSLENEMWSTSAYCLKNPWDPIVKYGVSATEGNCESN